MNDAVAAFPVGQALRDAREAQGLSVEDVANRLRLMHRQIDAMETGDFASLGQPVFARGFVRNYARLLGLDPDPMLARMVGAPAAPAPVSRDAPPPPSHWLTSPWLILLLLGVLLAAAVPIGLYWWLNSGADEDMPPRPMRNSVPLASAPPAPAVASSVETPVQTESGTADSPAAVKPAASAGQAEAASEPPAETPAATTSVVHLDFGGESWVEIKDASGRMLMRQLNPPGSSVDIKGQPPFDMVVGNAAQVRMTYNNRPIDLSPFVDVSVARFTLEE